MLGEFYQAINFLHLYALWYTACENHGIKDFFMWTCYFRITFSTVVLRFQMAVSCLLSPQLKTYSLHCIAVSIYFEHITKWHLQLVEKHRWRIARCKHKRCTWSGSFKLTITYSRAPHWREALNSMFGQTSPPIYFTPQCFTLMRSWPKKDSLLWI